MIATLCTMLGSAVGISMLFYLWAEHPSVPVTIMSAAFTFGLQSFFVARWWSL